MGVSYDSGALVAAERGERQMWARHRALLAYRHVPTVQAGVLAQVWRDGKRQALLSRLLKGCRVEPLDEDAARAVGVLIGRGPTNDVVDVSVVEGAIRRGDSVVSGDGGDLLAIAASVHAKLEVEAP